MQGANPFYFYFDLKKAVFILFIICISYPYTIYSKNLKRLAPLNIQTGYNEVEKPNPIWFSFKKKNDAHRKIIASVLAFPLPFGIIGLHRIYLGTKPYVPFVYIGTLGGGFGILPFIDFCVLLLDKDIDHYKSNAHIFMWIENQNKKMETEEKK